MTTWYAIYEKATGKLVSLGTVLASPLPEALEAKMVDEGEMGPGKVWNETLLKMEDDPNYVPPES